MKLGKIFALTGIQSGGKTTLALEIVTALKKKSINAWFALDIARTTTLPRHAAGGTTTQEAIAHRMCVALLETAAKHDIVITDRSPFDPVAYNIATGCPLGHSGTERIYRLAKDFSEEYISTIFVVKKGFDLHLDGDRDDDPVFYENSVHGFEQTYNRLHEEAEHLRLISLKDLEDPENRNTVRARIFNAMKVNPYE